MPGTWSCLLAFRRGRPKAKCRHHGLASKSGAAEINQECCTRTTCFKDRQEHTRPSFCSVAMAVGQPISNPQLANGLLEAQKHHTCYSKAERLYINDSGKPF